MLIEILKSSGAIVGIYHVNVRLKVDTFGLACISQHTEITVITESHECTTFNNERLGQFVATPLIIGIE